MHPLWAVPIILYVLVFLGYIRYYIYCPFKRNTPFLRWWDCLTLLCPIAWIVACGLQTHWKGDVVTWFVFVGIGIITFTQVCITLS
jgi:hypothetical protein